VLKAHAGKLRLSGSVARFFADQLTRDSLTTLDITPQPVLRVAELPRLHRDPFDRSLVAQAQVENMPLLSADTQIARYSVQVIW
jgi:PIN domain nuclease of toxin-antitoxin system